MTRYLFSTTCSLSKTTLTTPGGKLIGHSADLFNQEVINVRELEGLDFELRAGSSELFDILYVIRPSLNANGKTTREFRLF